MKKNLRLILLLCILAFASTYQASAQQLQAHKPKMELHGVSVSEIYPNPAEQVAYFDYRVPAGNKEVRMEVFNLIGEVIWREELQRESGTAALNLDQFKPGVYFYRLHVDNDKTSIKKLVIR